MPRAMAVLGLAFLASVACFGPDPNVTDTGKGLPELTIDFPATVSAGATETAVVTISNPGPGDMGSLTVSFTYVGAAATEELPEPLVESGTDEASPSIVAIRPVPNAISQDAVIYVFDGIAEGESKVIEFDILAPDRVGVFANSVVIYDSQEVERARGVRLETSVQR